MSQPTLAVPCPFHRVAFATIFLAFAIGVGLPIPACAQLSQNSGISSADTWVAVDLTITTSGTITLPQAVYNPATQTSSNVLNLAPPTLTFHVEAGYDSGGGLVMNVWPTGTPPDPDGADSDAIGFIRFAGGQMTIFDQNGNPISPVFPSGVPTSWPLSLFGSNPGKSVLQHLVVPNIQSYSSGIHAQYVTSGSNPTYAYVTPTMPSGSSAQWTYVSSGSNWIAQQFVLSVPASNGSGTRTVQFANMSWYDNATNDAARAGKGYTATAPPAATSTNPNGLTAGTPTSSPTSITQLGGTQNIVFQHGIFSSAKTWDRMKNWLNQDFRFGTEIIPSLSSTDSLSNQGTALKSQIDSAGGGGYILIGHSQGGLISRAAGQLYQTANSNQTTVAGVVTLDTPHQGAPIALTPGVAISAGLQALANNLWQSTGCITAYDNFICFTAALIYTGAPPAAAWFESQATPALYDLVPGSSFLNQLNSYPEGFKQAGIVSYTPMRFNEVRILDDFVFLPIAGCYPETWCGERVMAKDVQITYDVVLAWFFFALFEEFYDPNNFDYWAALADQLGQILFLLDAVDGFWNGIVSGFTSSDALVPVSSQNYPYTSAVQYPLHGADSHTGSTTSTYMRARLDQVLAGSQFLVPTQASCSFASSPSTYAISGNGGTSTFGVSTGAGCRWSATSNAAWISITNGASGTSSGNVSFSVAANPSTTPRRGTISVGNSSTTGTFTVQQAGVCTYSLSAGPTLALQASGGTYTVSVSTQNNCVWSAVSNSNWLTISAGASGTGSGSFSFTASPNSGSSDLTGIITVMSQTLTVIVGSPMGTPGTGSVTVQGSPVSQTFNMCPNSYPYHCPATIPDYGTISVTVANETFTVSYGSSSDTSASLATALANAINQQTLSPISASVSGSKITITSTINGAATNYPLSTSYTYNTTYYSYPAFTASASGASLTGGTD